MKKARVLSILCIIFLTVSCASLTRGKPDVERDNFLNQISNFNNEILGGLKYNDPEIDLRSLGYVKYTETFEVVDLTSGYKKVIDFINTNISAHNFYVQQNTFIICLRSESYVFLVCDDASTPYADKVSTEYPLPSFQDFCSSFLKENSYAVSVD